MCIVVLFCGKDLLYFNGNICLKEGDILCVIGQEYYLFVLGKLFSQLFSIQLDECFFGDFIFDVDVKFDDIFQIYGFNLEQGVDK